MVDLTSKIIGVESGGNPYATNPNSSAGGSGQFIDSTWLAMLKKYRPDLANTLSRADQLRLKFNDALSREMTNAYANENQAFLSSKGVPVDDTSTYLAHFAGPQGAVGLYSNPDASAESILGSRVVSANPFLRGKSGQDVIDWASSKMSPGQRMMASSLRKFGGAKVGAEATTSQGGAIAKLLPAMAPGIASGDAAKTKYEDQSSRLARAEAATKAGQEYAKKAGSWWEVAASIANAGVGAYLKDKAVKGEQANSEGFITAIKSATTPREQAEVFLSYPQTMEYGAKMLTTIGAKPAEEWVPTADGQYLVEKHTGKTKPTGYVKGDTSEFANKLKAMGLQPGTPEYQDAARKILMNERLTEGDRKRINEADTKVSANQDVIRSIDAALAKNEQAFSGPMAGTRGYFMSLFGDEGGKATQDTENLITNQALGQLRTIFGANPTEGERQILLELQGSVSQAPEVRKAIWERARKAAEIRMGNAQREADQIRTGEFYKPGGGVSNPGVNAPTVEQGVYDAARKAIQEGRDPNAVKQRLIEGGYDPNKL